MVVAIVRREPLESYLVWDFWWVAYFAVAALIFYPRKLGYWFIMALSVVQIVVILVQLGAYFTNLDTTYWRLSWLAHQVFVLGTFMWIGLMLFKLQRKSS